MYIRVNILIFIYILLHIHVYIFGHVYSYISRCCLWSWGNWIELSRKGWTSQDRSDFSSSQELAASSFYVLLFLTVASSFLGSVNYRQLSTFWWLAKVHSLKRGHLVIPQKWQGVKSKAQPTNIFQGPFRAWKVRNDGQRKNEFQYSPRPHWSLVASFDGYGP